MDGPAANARTVEESFYDANRRILGVAKELRVDGPVPFLCECSDARCHQVIRMPWLEFESLHRRVSRFVVAPGHSRTEDERLVTQTETYDVVEKRQP